jgi:protein-disulfide isomerase
VIRASLAALLTVGALTGCAAKASTGTPAAFTPAQRAQVVQIVRDALEKDPSILREAILALQADNARIEADATRAALVREHNAIFDSHDATTGNPDGTVTIAEFFDPSCPYCRKLAPQMTEFLAQNHDVRLIYKDMPILGPASELGSRALLAAQRQGAYERLRDALMRGSDDITTESIHQAVDKLGLNWPRLQHDMADRSIAQQLATNEQIAKTLSVESTPTLVIGSRIIAGPDMSQIADAVAAARRKN